MRHLDLIGWPLSEALATVQRDCPGLIVQVTGCNPLKSYEPKPSETRVVRQRWGDGSLELTVSVFQEFDHERYSED
jgi:hypothetical protein